MCCFSVVCSMWNRVCVQATFMYHNAEVTWCKQSIVQCVFFLAYGRCVFSEIIRWMYITYVLYYGMAL